MVFLITGQYYIISEVETHPHTDRTLWPWQAFSPHVTHNRTHAQQQHRHRTPFRDIRHVLTTAKFTWHWSVWSDPRKASWTHKRAGAFVFVECHTSSWGKPVTGPGRPLKPEGGVCGNRLCGYLWCQLQYWNCGLFPGLGLCLSAERETIPRLCIRAQTS